jgi:magnesium chelatase subunit I
VRDDAPAAEAVEQFRQVPQLLESLGPLGAGQGAPLPTVAAAAEFVLEGLWAQKKIGRSDDRGFVASERRTDTELDLERLERLRRMKKQVN